MRRPPKVAGQIRIVEIAGFDYSACGGTHVRTTAEVAPFKVLRQERRKWPNGLTFRCGLRACGDYADLHPIAGQTAQIFSTEVSAAPGLVRARSTRTAISSASSTSSRNRSSPARSMVPRRPAALAGRRVVARLYPDRSVDALKATAARLRGHPQTVALLATNPAAN